ncbi:hypothetical protein JCM8097_003738 [Rhodosporidiobolus ruineniae]
MRPSLSLLPALAALAALPAGATGASQPSSPALDSPLRPQTLAFTAFTAPQPPAGAPPPPPLGQLVLSATAQSGRAEAAGGALDGEELSEPEAASDDGDDEWEHHERWHEEREERQMWRELLASVSATGEISELFLELVRDADGDGEGPRVFHAPPPAVAAAMVASSPPPPPAMLPPAFIPSTAVYHVPSPAPPAQKTHDLAYSAQVLLAAARDRLLSLLPSLPSLSRNSTAALFPLPRPSLSALTLRRLPTAEAIKDLPPSFSLSFAAPAGIGLSRR